MTKLQQTEERTKIISAAKEDWLQVGLCTDPADFDAAEAAITELYKGIDLDRPEFVRVPSPFAAEKHLNSLTGSSQKYTGTWFAGQWDAWLWGWAETGRKIGAKYPKELNAALDAHCIISRSIGWFYPYPELCIMSDRPEKISFDDEDRLHCEDGPAILFRDGYSMFAWRGQRVPGEWITNPESITPETALHHENIEMRRAACEIIGWDRILTELNAVTVQKDDDPEIGELLEVDIPDIGKEKFLRVRCGTGRIFAIPVPPEMTTALEANAWTFNLDQDLISNLEVRT